MDDVTRRTVASLDQLNSLSHQINENLIYLDDSRDEFEVSNLRIAKSTFKNVGMKKVKMKNSSLTQCYFDYSYLRNATFENVDFTGSVFVNCNLEKANFHNCNFTFVRFFNSLINFESIITSLPGEPNLRLAVIKNLKVNFKNVGENGYSDALNLMEIKTRELELKEIFHSRTDYYRRNFDSLDRILAACNYMGSKVSGLIWGHGHKIRRLLMSYIALILVFSAFTYFGEISFATTYNSTPAKLSWWDSLYLTSFSLVAAGSPVHLPANSVGKTIIFLENFLGTLFLALLASSFFKKILK